MSLRYISFAYLLFYIVVFFSTDVFAMVKKLQLESHLTKQIESILNTSQLLHQSLISEENIQIKLHLSHIASLISSASQTSYRNTKTLHLRHILQNTKKAVEQASLHGKRSLIRQNIKSMFDELVVLSQVYKLNSRYPIYFCDKDKSVWLQKAGRIRNPIHSHYSLCGYMVN